MSNPKELFTLYIYTSETANRDVDLKQILQVFGYARVRAMTWGIDNPDWFWQGEGELWEELEANRAIIVPGERFIKAVEQVYQTLEGHFWGYPSAEAAKEFLEKFGWIHDSQAEIQIEALQNMGFEVSLRSREDAERMAQAFEGVEWETPLPTL